VLADVHDKWHGERVAFLTGWEAGGHTVWAQAMRHPERWRGVAPVTPNYQRRGLDSAAFSRAPERTSLPIQVLLCGAPTADARQALAAVEPQIALALGDARDHGFPSRPERVIVETSGVALPYDTLITFWRDPVRAWAVDESSVVVVSAEQVAAGRDLDSTFEDQVCSADLLLLSKTDLVGESAAAGAEALLARMQPDAPIVRATHGDVDSRVFFPPEPRSRPSRAAQTAPEQRPHTHDFVSEEIGFADGTF